jgi:hypothetical protein
MEGGENEQAVKMKGPSVFLSAESGRKHIPEVSTVTEKKLFLQIFCGIFPSLSRIP